MRHDTFVSDGPFEDAAPGRALTQVCRQVRAEFLLVYKHITKIHVPLEDLEGYIDTWLQAPVSGTVIIDPHRYDMERRDAGSMNGTHGNLIVDLTPLIKRRRENRDFHFYINMTPDTDDPDADDSDTDGSDDDNSDDDLSVVQVYDIEDDVVKVEFQLHNWSRRWAIFYLVQGCAKIEEWKDALEEWDYALVAWLRKACCKGAELPHFEWLCIEEEDQKARAVDAGH